MRQGAAADDILPVPVLALGMVFEIQLGVADRNDSHRGDDTHDPLCIN